VGTGTGTGAVGVELSVAAGVTLADRWCASDGFADPTGGGNMSMTFGEDCFLGAIDAYDHGGVESSRDVSITVASW
jgi:hypothetical protein